jgi:hypothetical protein
MRARRIDTNQPQLVKQMRQVGMSVFVTSMIGKGFVDCVCGYRGINFLLEIKDPSQPPSKRKLTDDEQAFHDSWRGNTHVVETIFDVMRILNEVNKTAERTASGTQAMILEG